MVLLSEDGGAFCPLSTYPCPFLGPSPSVGSGAHPSLTPSCPRSPGLALSLPPCSPFLSLGRLCQRSPRTVPVSLLCVGSTRRSARAIPIGQVRPGGHPIPAVGNPPPPLQRRLLGPGILGGTPRGRSSTCGQRDNRPTLTTKTRFPLTVDKQCKQFPPHKT